MDLLEYYQNQLPQNDHFVPRKVNIPVKGNLNFHGVRGSGKTAIILDYLNESMNEEILYIDCEDPHLLFNELDAKTMQTYINAHKINLLILDHYTPEILPSIPTVFRLIIITRVALKKTTLSTLELFPLDYEEFLAFENHSTQNHSFNHFLRLGTLPLLAKSTKKILPSFKLFFQSSFNPQEQKLLLLLAQHHTQHLTIHQIYTFAKNKFKISKDWIYKTIKNFKEEKLIFFIDDRIQSAGKKMLLFDFAFAKYLTIGQPFILQFDTMIALALIKHHIHIETLGIHGYITLENELIIPAPFESEESLWVKSQSKFALYKKYHIRKVTIITITNTYQYSIEQIEFEALPFDEWVVINDEDFS